MLVLNDLRVSQFENEVRVVKRLFIWRQTPRIYTTLDYLLGEEGRARENTRKPHCIADNVVLVGSGPLLRMAGYESLCELFFMSKCYFDRVNPLEPNFLVLNNNDIHRVRSKIVKIIKIFEKLEHLKTNRP